MNTKIEYEGMNLVAILNPRIFINGKKWCVLYGKDLQDGIAGFGETPRKAVLDFNKAWDRQILPSIK